MGNFIEKIILSRDIDPMAELQAMSEAMKSSSIGGLKRNMEDVSTIVPYN